jgi:hypothetical protein
MIVNMSKFHFLIIFEKKLILNEQFYQNIICFSVFTKLLFCTEQQMSNDRNALDKEQSAYQQGTDSIR